MSILIGIKDVDNIRYITADYPQQFEKIVHTLKNFYKSPEKVKALIDLGHLDWLGASPYKKSKGINDLINCESRIRDKKLSPGKHGWKTVRSNNEFVEQLERNPGKNLNCCFLFEDSKWFILIGNHKENIGFIDETILKKSQLMDGLNVYVYEPDNQYNRLATKSFYSWYEVQQSADEKQIPHYIFRGERFLTTITPNPIKEIENVVSDN
jgi:hypothetical protein